MSVFDHEFEMELLAGAARDRVERKRLKRLLAKADPWSSPGLRGVWGLLAQMGDDDVLTRSLIARHVKTIKDDDEAEEVAQVALEALATTPTAFGWATNVLEEWVRKAALTDGIGKVISFLSKDNVADAELALRKIQATGAGALNLTDGGDWFDGFDGRQQQRLLEKTSPDLRPVIPLHLQELDDKFKGGIRVEEVGLIVGYTNVGKSFFALHTAFASAASGFTTVYISTEMSKMLVDTRLDAKFFQRPSDDFYDYRFTAADLSRFEDKRARLTARMKERLFTYSTPVNSLTKHGIEAILDDVEAVSGTKVNLLVLDTADHMLPLTTIRDKRLQQSAVYWDVKAVAAERKLAVWTTCHTGGDGSKALLTEFDQAESREKGKIADKIITLNQTAAEYREDILRAYIAKNRGGDKGDTCWIATDFARASIERADPPAATEEDEDE